MSTTMPHCDLKLLGAASCWGAPDRRCNRGPELLRSMGLERMLQAAGCEAGWQVVLHPHKISSITDTYDIVADFCRRLAGEVATAVQAGTPFAVLGGDHSCAIGTWSGAAAAMPNRRPIGLIWIDAHMDSHTPETSLSGALHGMPLASLLGYGDPRLSSVEFAGPKLLAEHVCLIGVRSYEASEAEFLKQHKVRVYFMDEVRARGLSVVMNEAYDRVAHGTAGFGVSIDLDAIDPHDAPGVGSPEPGGIAAADLLRALAPLAMQPGLLGIEIAEFNPAQDHNDETVRLIRALCEAFFAGGAS